MKKIITMLALLFIITGCSKEKYMNIDNVSDIAFIDGTIYAIKKDNSLWTWGVDNHEYTSNSIISTPLKIYDNIDFFYCDFGVRNYYEEELTDTILFKSGNEVISKGEKGFYVKSQNVRSISCSEDNVGILFEDNHLTIAGSNTFGQFGNGAKDNDKVSYRVLEDVKKHSSSLALNYALTYTGTLYRWGSTIYHFENSYQALTPEIVMENVKDFKMNYSKTLILTNDNKLWGVGSNFYKELIVDTKYVNTPVELLDDVKEYYNYGNLIYAIKSDGSLWESGFDESISPSNISGEKNKFVKVMENVKDVIQYGDTIFILTSEDMLYTWGKNEYGQLGLKGEIVKTLTKVSDNVKKVYPGGQTSFIIKKDNTLWASGSNLNGQLGTSNTKSIYGFKKISEDVEEVLMMSEDKEYEFNISRANEPKFASKAATIILKTDGTLYGAGYNFNNILGNLKDETHDFVEIKFLKEK